MTTGVHFERTETYDPVPHCTNIKLQLALTAKDRFGLRVFDCTAAYLQAELKKSLYARSPKGLMSVIQKEMGEKLGSSPSDIWKKDPDYFLGCVIEWDSETGVIQLDNSKYLREVIAKFDMVGAHPSPIPAPAGMKIYVNENWDGDEKFRNLYQQY
jgi:hypothetical protein